MPDESKTRVTDPTSAPPAREDWPLIVYCHLRWDFVWQRPQQLFSRLASRHRVLFVEEPIVEQGAEASLRITEVQANVLRVVPILPEENPDVDARSAQVRGLLQRAMKAHPLLKGRFDSPVEWFYSPMTARALQGQFGEIATVYDCMDELAQFRFAPSDIREREQALIERADVVFTGGFELLQAKAKLHHNVHFYGCGVDAQHYAKARDDRFAVPDEVADLPHPVLGYFGVIDERLDYGLIAALADRFSEGTVVMVGPLAKVDPASLPKRPNLIWLGQRSYDELPMLVKSFDVCLMPFAMNEATQFINPTKTLEYMAAGKPVVSTPVPDVVRRFASNVAIGNGQEDFVRKVEEAVRGRDPGIIESGIAIAADSSWDAIVSSMESQITACLPATIRA